MIKIKKIQYKKVAFALSLCMLVLWGILGTGTSLAWFTDTSTELKNIFHMAEFGMKVSYRQPDGTYKDVEQDTAVFDDEALYEPGYVQVVYLKIENMGSVPFDCEMAISVEDCTVAKNVFGKYFYLYNYLKFGVVFAEEESELLSKVNDRVLASQAAGKILLEEEASMPIGIYDSDIYPVNDGDDIYAAIIVRMPEEVGNEANYRGDVQPMVELGIIVRASQQRK